MKPFLDSDNPPRPAARAIRWLKAEEAFGDSVHRPYLHLVDGGVSDNVGMRAVLDSLEVWRRCTKPGCLRRSTMRAGSSCSSSIRCPRPRPTGTNRRTRRHRGRPAEGGRRSDRRLFLRSGRAAERHRCAVADAAPDPQLRRLAANKDPAVAAALSVPEAEIYAIDVSFPMLKDKAERTISISNPRPSCCPPRPSIACALRPGRSSWIPPNSSDC